MAIAFFDLDKTLLCKNSGALWVASEMKKGFIPWRQALVAWIWLTRYHLGFSQLEEVILKSIGSLKGQLEEDIRNRSLAFYESKIRHLIRPGAWKVLQKHRDAGDQLLLLTSSSNYLSEPITSQLEMDGYLCNRFETDYAGRYTGQPLGTLCFGKGKLEVAQQYAQKVQVSLSQCTFYSDSASDLPVFEAVGRPVAVHPDPRLKRIALQRGWEIARWGKPKPWKNQDT